MEPSREQLLREHQDYWLQIVRLEEDCESLRGQLDQLRSRNQQCLAENEDLRLAREKTSALLSEVQEGHATIERLQEQVAVLSLAPQKVLEEREQLGIAEARCQQLERQLREQVIAQKQAEEQRLLLAQQLLSAQQQAQALQNELSRSVEDRQQAEEGYSSRHRRSVTELSLAQARAERENAELRAALSKSTEQVCSLKKQLSQVKAFAHSKLSQILQLRREKEVVLGPAPSSLDPN